MYERKSTMSRRVIDETTLRIYVPKHVGTVDTNSTIQTNAATSAVVTSPGHFHQDTLLSQTKATDSTGPLRCPAAHSPLIYTMIT